MTATDHPGEGAPGREDEGRLQPVMPWIPYIGLAIAALLALVIGPTGGSRVALVLILTSAAALWQYLMHVPETEREQHRVKAVVFYL